MLAKLFSKSQSDAMRTAVDQAIDAVITINTQNNITYLNKAAENLFGYSAYGALGKNVKLLVPSEFKRDHDSYVNANRNGGRDKIVGTSRDIQIETRSGERRWCSLSLSKVRMPDGIHSRLSLKI